MGVKDIVNLACFQDVDLDHSASGIGARVVNDMDKHTWKNEPENFLTRNHKIK